MPQHDVHPSSPRSVLVGVHLDERNDVATVETAAAYAEKLGAELVLAGVAPIAEPVLTDAYMALDGPSAPPLHQQQMIDRLARERLEEAASAVPEAVAARTVLNWGTPGLVLVETAAREGAELIVVPMRHEGALGHLLHDGDDRYVLHHSDVPVLVVPVPG